MRPIFSRISITAMLESLRCTQRYSSIPHKQMPRTHPMKPNNRILTTSYVLLIIPVTAFSLGTWQIYRRGWKFKLIEEIEDKTNRDPIALPDDLSEISNMEYVNVRVRGEYDHSREFLLGPRNNIRRDKDIEFMLPAQRRGYCVITPFVLSDRPLTILVNRGWVHDKIKDPKYRQAGQTPGEIEITGCLRQSEKHTFGMAAMADQNIFLIRDIDLMSRYGVTSPVFIDADYLTTVDGGPEAGQTRKLLRNEHGSYIITWYSLALVTFIFWLYRFKRPPLPDAARLYNHYREQR